jgi:hypothetical protein
MAVFAKDHLGHLVDRLDAPFQEIQVLNDDRLGALFQEQKIPEIGNPWLTLCPGEMDQVNRFPKDRALGDVEEGPVLEEGGIEPGERIGSLFIHPVEVLLYKVLIFLEGSSQAFDPDSGRILPLGGA